MKPLTISDFSFTIKKPSSTVVAEPTEKPKVNETKPPEPAIDTSKLTDEQAEKFKGLLSVDPENAKDITVEEYIALAESVMTFKEETIEGYSRVDDPLSLSAGVLKVRLLFPEKGDISDRKVANVFENSQEWANRQYAEHSSYSDAVRIADKNLDTMTEFLMGENIRNLQAQALELLPEEGGFIIDEHA
ncbi:hypothetical protein KF946_10630 [Idiomarina loihiensis]|jgi:hypothetical protein|uniref:Uncharacterized protein n=1 Tax=Idiomarina loihiensis (strain ATCC BAA-735 / DSM 15497 / L2-TR) TaxID=283942 RepID=Q5QZ93_IDILO|nr:MULTISPECIES: hypothetical protein [Idiomarina]AAV81053.1 Hypothetical protein IL0210 [Idiomarina loihiensis L2TR]AGM35077.1 hypothetical protein K734_01050 [Idiomarina loihiensis GSL 199]MBL4855852.1 hypothetical protein [Idiomarina sp.]MRJ44508.1 hypothetical protein [Idiomarina loihiensis]PHQ92928.1 MAG: hypothetical protein COB44_00585 [Idiomarina sp.]